jgi:type I restriction enzyme R subunit
MTATMHTTEKDIQGEMLDVLQGFGWSFIPRKEMNDLRGSARMNEAIVEPLLVDGIRALNPELDEDAAREVAALVRRVNTDREMLDVLRRGVPYKPAPDQPTVDVTIVDSRDPRRNSYVVTEELALRTGGSREPRLDVVCLVNGIPLGAIENKDTDEPLDVAATDWAGYWNDVPQLIAQTNVVGCCNGLRFRVGPSGLDDISNYHEWSDPWPNTVADLDDEMFLGLSAFHPHTLVDLAANFVIFETREGITVKKLSRAHQYRATDKLVKRVVDGKLKRGIVWHATGSGKSLTMVFAARKLLRAGLGNPTVLIIIDRKELDEQINETLVATEFEGIQQPRTRKRLAELLSAGGGGVIVTTAQKFDQSMAGLLKEGEVIAFVDEAHRTQYGDFGMFMRDALPDAFLFGFTGTPIEQGGKHSTRRWFSVQLPDGNYEPYLDRYGFDQAIADKATVPVVYEPRLDDWRLSRIDVDAKFDELTEGLPEDVREKLREQATRQKVVAKAPARVKALAADIAEQLRDRISPFSGLAAAIDREACALVAEALAEHLQANEYAVVMSRSKKDAAPHEGGVDLRYWYPVAQWERVHGRLAGVTHDVAGEAEPDEDLDEDEEYVAVTDRAAIKDFIKRLKSENDPLRLLIVNSMLLTGFDAPPVQVLFLDRGLRDHGLMQAIARTNRRYPGKDYGIVVDYWGTFDNLKDALKEFAAEDLTGLVEDTETLIAGFPELLDRALAVVAEAPAGSGRRRMLWVVRHFADNPEEAERFKELVGEVQGAWETLAPDPRLVPYKQRYSELLEVWLAWRRGTRSDRRRGSGQLRRKTQQLVQENIGFERLHTELPAHTIDAEFLAALQQEVDLTPEEKATDIEAAMTYEVKVRGQDDPRSKAIIERLNLLRRKRERDAQMTLDGLKEWEDLVRDYVAEDEEMIALGLDDAGAVTHAVMKQVAPAAPDDELVEIARSMSDRFRETAGFTGWSERSDVVQGLRKAAIQELVSRENTRQLALDPQVVDELLAGLATLDREWT